MRAAGRLNVMAWIAIVLIVLYLGATFGQIWWTASRDASRPAQAIVVLGAAQYDGRPSPVLRARLDHAVTLYEEQIAPLIVVTGGQRPGDRFTEARAAAEYLHEEGVPGPAIERETTGATSYESLAATARFLREQEISRVVLVSDPFHAYRITAIAGEVGLEAYSSPTPTSAISGRRHWWHLARETLAVSVGRLVGYRRLERFEDVLIAQFGVNSG